MFGLSLTSQLNSTTIYNYKSTHLIKLLALHLQLLFNSDYYFLFIYLG